MMKPDNTTLEKIVETFNDTQKEAVAALIGLAAEDTKREMVKDFREYLNDIESEYL